MTARYRVEIAPAAQRQLKRLPPGSAAVLRGPILALAQDPRPTSAAKLAGADIWRLRVGAMRVLYAIDEPARLVVIVKVARRSESIFRRVP